MIIGEAPGKEEAETGRPFVGMSGQELSGYLKRAGINEKQVFICNTVYCWPPKNRVPKPSELKCCRQNLDDNINMVEPEVIVTLGKTATEALLGGDIKMDAVRGIPVRMGNGTVVVPSFHPAYALRSTQYMTHIQQDFNLVADILRAGGASRERLAPASTEVILAQSLDDVTGNINNSLVAVDTEWANNKPWCLSFCTGGPGVVVMAEDTRLLEEVNAHLSKLDVTTILHNALYDIKVLEQLGVYPSRVEDTIIMAHLLQDEPKSLKSLAIRHLGLDMHEYDDVTSPASDDRAAQYLYKVTGIEWPEVDPIETIVKGTIKRRQPQNIGKRAQKILDDYAKKKCSPYKRWKLIDLAEGRQLVEQAMGKMPRGELSDVDPGVAVKYAGTDAIATYHIYPRLAERIKKAKLLNAFDLDMSTVKMISDMQDRGILLDKDRLKEVSSGLRKEMDDALVSLEIHHRKVNPNSPKDVAKYLHEVGVFIRPTQSTESKYLQKYVEKSVEVRMILKYRVAAKLLSTYIEALPHKADSKDRIHTRYSMTTTLTGRLSSSDPNCFSGDTEVLTKEGWVRFDELDPTRKVMQWDNGILSFVNTTGYVKLRSDNVMHINNQHIDLLVTGNHRCLTINRKTNRQNITPAEAYPKDAVQLNAGRWLGGQGIPLSDDEIRVLLMIQADGSITSCGMVDMSFHKERKWERAKELLDSTGLCHRFVDNGNRKRFYIKDSSELRHILSFLGTDKTFGKWVFQMSREQTDVFLDEITFWDGCFTRNNHYSCNQKINVDLVQALYTLSNKRAVVRRYEHPGGKTNWQIDLTQRDYSLTTNVNRTVTAPQTVFCVSVPSTFLLVRRNGKTMITGNCQNIPARTEAGRAIRSAFIPTGEYKFLGMDYSQIEVRLAAHESQDKLLVRLLREGADIHGETSQRIFGDAEKEHRYAAKRVGFGILYGISAKGLSEQIGWSEPECQDLIDDWFGVYTGVHSWIKRTHEETSKTGIARDWNGRYRLIPEVNSVHRRIREEGNRYAVNAKIQVGAGSILKRAIADLTPVYVDMQKNGFPVYPLLQIHDELVWEVSDEHVDYVQHVFKGIMENCVKISVPLVVDAHTAVNWGELK
jgi:uracil-DNA glycosylase family 4